MFNPRSIKKLVSLIATCASLLTLVALSGGLVACRGSGEQVKYAKIKPGSMPDGGEWTGVYYSTIYGHLHLIKEGDTVSGKWRTTSGDKWGEMSGKVTGNVFRYEWKEHTIGVVSSTSTTSGHGYFQYVIPKGENVEHEIRGEWGLGQSEAGQKWVAIKQRNQNPDPESVMPDETQTETGVEGWDKAPGEKKKAPKKDDKEDEEEESTDDWD